MPVVEEYWAGVVQRLQAEVDVFARLVRHHATQGQENEAALSRMLRAFIPRSLGVGTGMVIDRLDNYSRQTDIIIFEQSDEPAILAQTNQLIYPVESVLACIEVKTRLRNDDVADCRAKQKALLELDPACPYPDGTSHPLFIVLAYDSQLAPVSIHERFSQEPTAEWPDLYCVLEPGIVGGRQGVLRGIQSSFASGIALLRELDGNGRRTGSPIALSKDRLSDAELIEGRPYPVVKVRDKLCLGDPPRALLLFVEALARAIANQQQRRPPVLAHYINEQFAELSWL
jgi:hypothetical protein